jgi:hypothetical protein
MVIAVAGPYSADTEVEMQSNLDAMNDACAEVYKKGHIPVVGVNNALPVVNRLNGGNWYEAIMKISLAIIERCDAILILGTSPGVLMEKDIFIKRSLPVYYSIEEIPDCEL